MNDDAILTLKHSTNKVKAMITFETHFLIMLATLERSTPTEIGIDPNHGRVECSRFEIVDD